MTTPQSTGVYDVRRGGWQRVHTESPGRCWEWVHAGGHRTLAVHISAGRPCWWLPNAGRRRYAGITEWRAGWLLLAIQVATRPTPTPQAPADGSPR